MRRLLVTCLLFSFTAQALAAPPTKVQAHYDVLRGDIIIASIAETFTRTQKGYRIESVSKAVGLFGLFKPETIRVTSEGLMTARGLRPVTFTSTRRLDSERNTRADFDWADNRITLNDRLGKRTVPLRSGTQDRLSAMYQFMFLALNNVTDLRFDMTNGSKVDNYSYRLTPGRSVTVPAGKFDVIYVASPQEAGASRTEIWLAVQRYNFPCKMVITEPDGSKYTQVLTQVEFVP